MPQRGFGLQPRVGAAGRFAATTLGTRSGHDPSTPNGVASDVVRLIVTLTNRTNDATLSKINFPFGPLSHRSPISSGNFGEHVPYFSNLE